MSGVYRYAIENGITDIGNPCINCMGNSTVKLPPRVKGCEKDIFTPDEIEDMFGVLEAQAKASDAVWRDIVLYYSLFFSAMTGVRGGELAALEWSDIDRVHGTVIVNKHAVFKKGHGSVDKAGTKAGGGKTRVISPPDRLFGVLDEYKLRHDDYAAPFKEAGMWDCNKVFPSENGKSLYVSQLSKWLTAFFKRQGNEDGYKKPHTMRHYNITMRILGGDDLLSITYDGGWADSQVMLREYAHYNAVRNARKNRALDVLNFKDEEAKN
jgi:integrase